MAIQIYFSVDDISTDLNSGGRATVKTNRGTRTPFRHKESRLFRHVTEVSLLRSQSKDLDSGFGTVKQQKKHSDEDVNDILFREHFENLFTRMKCCVILHVHTQEGLNMKTCPCS